MDKVSENVQSTPTANPSSPVDGKKIERIEETKLSNTEVASTSAFAGFKQNLANKTIVWKELTDDLNQSLKNMKESAVYQSVEQRVGNISKAVHEAPLYQKTETIFKSTTERTTSLFRNITASFDTTLNNVKESQTVQTLGSTMGSLYGKMKNRIGTRCTSATFPDSVSETGDSDRKES